MSIDPREFLAAVAWGRTRCRRRRDRWLRASQLHQLAFGIAASVTLFGDRLSPLLMAGVPMIIVGVGLAIQRQCIAKQVVEAEPAPVR